MSMTYSESRSQTEKGQRDADASMQRANLDTLEPTSDAVEYLRVYARQRPEVAAMWCFGIGFILGWKLKPW
ncbi:MAG: hypothetical protein CMJ58_27020 [Planctomycetaceae bacterium]|nr:hypothetical protein [Planctomycetaceae bacterium]